MVDKKVNALLHLANKSEVKRGKLKIFLGFAPGVGKTYAMLNQAQALKKEGLDVAIGLIVTHGRKDTQDLCHDIEVIPLKEVLYREKKFFELDTDAIIKQNPKFVIVDELPHTNIGEARNKKRYTDILEILDAGINVYTALNIQHIVSLSSEVSAITESQVTEVVPDSFIQSADELVVIDITPEELIKRLHDGKVYQQDTAHRALERYFKYTNLSILRDYTFRLAANHVGHDIRHYKSLYKPKEILGHSPTVLVCCAYDDSTPKLLRKGKQLASASSANIIAIFIQQPHRQFSKLQLRAIRRYKMLAQDFGYQIEHISGVKLSSSILEYAIEHEITDIVIGKSERPKWKDILFGSVVYDVIRHSQGRQIHIVSIKKRSTVIKNKTIRIKQGFSDILKSSLLSFSSGVLIFFCLNDIDLTAKSLILVLVLMICAYRYGMRASISSSFIVFILYMYMYLTPTYKFTIGTLTQIITFGVFVIVAMVMSQLTIKSKMLITALRQREKTLTTLYNFSNTMTKTPNDNFRKIFLNELVTYFKYDFVFFDSTENSLGSPYPQHPNLNQKEWVAAKWCWQHKTICGISTNTFSGLSWYFEPLLVEGRILGVMAIYVRDQNNVEYFLAEQSILKTMLAQVSNLLLKRHLEKEEHKLAVLAEQERLQKALLSSVSHDLKTPLASIMGSLSSVISYNDKFSEADKIEMLSLAFDESKRLEQYIDNVVQMLKVESGFLKLHKVDFSALDFFNDIKMISSTRFIGYEIKIIQSDAKINIYADRMLLEQVIFNLIGNAVKFSPEHKSIELICKLHGNNIGITVRDFGIGISSESIENVFNLFHRIEKKDSYTQGNGLGLAICKGIVEAHGGNIKAKSDGIDSGSKFIINLPRP